MALRHPSDGRFSTQTPDGSCKNVDVASDAMRARPDRDYRPKKRRGS